MFLVVDVLYYETDFVVDVIIRTNILIYLNQSAIPLRQIHTTLLNNIHMILIRFSLNRSLTVIRTERQINVERLSVPLRNYDDKILPRL